jgi:hypothetical protein
MDPLTNSCESRRRRTHAVKSTWSSKQRLVNAFLLFQVAPAIRLTPSKASKPHLVHRAVASTLGTWKYLEVPGSTWKYEIPMKSAQLSTPAVSPA